MKSCFVHHTGSSSNIHTQNDSVYDHPCDIESYNQTIIELEKIKNELVDEEIVCDNNNKITKTTYDMDGFENYMTNTITKYSLKNQENDYVTESKINIFSFIFSKYGGFSMFHDIGHATAINNKIKIISVNDDGIIFEKNIQEFEHSSYIEEYIFKILINDRYFIINKKILYPVE